MLRRAFVVLPVLTALAVAAPAGADPARSVTATGTGQVKVVPKNRHSNASIKTAVDAAEKAAVPAAIAQAHEYAQRYAKAASLTLGAIISVSDVQSGFGAYAGPGTFIGPFGPNRFCGVIPPHVFKRVVGPNHKVTVVKTKRRRRCFVPSFASSTLTVTYSAT
jgi:uncharacterized protein YggE